MRYLLLIFVVVFALPCFSVQAEPAADNLSTLETGTTAEQGIGEWLNSKLVPSHTCPHCKQTFSEKNSLLMLIIGFVGQALFTSRFIVQWIASEQRKKSFIPVTFWYLSIAGSLLLLAYAISIMAWPIILGQCFGVIVYGRNLVLITQDKNKATRELQDLEASEGINSETTESER